MAVTTIANVATEVSNPSHSMLPFRRANGADLDAIQMMTTAMTAVTNAAEPMRHYPSDFVASFSA